MKGHDDNKGGANASSSKRSICAILLMGSVLLFESAYIYFSDGGGRDMLTTERKMAGNPYAYLSTGDANKDTPTALQVASSHDYIVNVLGRDECKFPEMFDKVKPVYPLRDITRGETFVTPGDWREKFKDAPGMHDAKDVLEQVQLSRSQNAKAAQKNNELEKPKKSLTYVHIGKAGGSSMNCHLATVQEWCDESCVGFEEVDGKVQVPDTAISRHVNCYTHLNNQMQCYHLQEGYPLDKDAKDYKKSKMLKKYRSETGNDYLVNLRSPLDRIASWFLFEHAENGKVSRPSHKQRCGQLILDSCFRNFEDLTTIGLGGPAPHPNTPLKISLNLTAEQCSHWAWAALSGNVPADSHNIYNYEWYGYWMLQNNRTSHAKIYALRMEHLEHDWSTVDKMLGGDGVVPSTLMTRQNNAATKPLRVTDHSTTDEGRKNLCRVLCKEIQAYKEILVNSINLGPDDLQASLDELRNQCPEEVDLSPRECPEY